MLIVDTLQKIINEVHGESYTDGPTVIQSTTKIMSMWDTDILNKNFTYLWPANRGTLSEIRSNPIGFEEYIRHLVLLSRGSFRTADFLTFVIAQYASEGCISRQRCERLYGLKDNLQRKGARTQQLMT